METLTIKVKGMVCHGCENRIQKVLNAMDEVEEVHADYQTGLVTVKTNTKVNETTLDEKIEDLGFEVVKDI